MGDGQEAGGVTRDEAIKFLETACRNWQHVGPLRDDDLSDVADALSRFVKARATPSSNEAVAWMYVDKHGCKRVWLTRQSLGYVQAEQEIPLYAHPPAASSVEPIDDASLRAMIGELGNQIHNLGCEHQGDEKLSGRLQELCTYAWKLSSLAPAASSGVASDDEVETVARALNSQMEAQADDLTPSSVQREKGLFWLEGWFDLKAAISALKAKP